MRPKSLKWLEDIRTSCEFILQFSKARDLSDYESDPMLRAAIERHFEIIGEAMTRLNREDPETAILIDDHKRIIAFRNVLIHGYDLVQHDRVWHVVQHQVPQLLEQVKKLLDVSQ